MPTDGRPDQLSRRKWLALLGTGATGSVAGCPGSGGGGTATQAPGTGTDDDGDGGDGGTSPTDGTATATPTATQTPTGPPMDSRLDTSGLQSNLTSANYRVGHPDMSGTVVPEMVYAPSFLYYPTAPEGERFQPYILRNPQEKGDWMHFDVIEGATWHDGTEITAEDVAFNLNLDQWGAGASGLFLATYKEIETTGEYGVKIYRKGMDQQGRTYTTNPSIWWPRVADHSPLRWKPEHWEWALQEFKDRTNAIGDTPGANVSMKGALRQAVFDPGAENEISDEIEAGPRNADGADWPVGSDIWKLGNVAANYAEFELHEDHPLSENVAYEKIRMRNTNDSRLQAAMSNDAVDLAQGALDATMSQARENGEIADHWQYAQAPVYGGRVFLFSGIQKNPVRNRDVRAALTHVFDRKAAGQKLLNHEGVEIPIVLPDQGGVLDFWFDEETQDQFIKYTANDAGRSRAAELLQRQGFERNGNGQWISTKDEESWGIEEGDPLSLKVIVPNDNVGSTIGSQISSDLDQFGVDVTYQALGGGSFGGVARTGAQLQLYTWSGAIDPYTAYGRLGATMGTGFWPWGWELNQTIPEFGKPDAEPSIEFNIRSAKDTEWPQAETIGQAREIAKMMCWFQNWHLAEFPVTISYNQNFVSTDEWRVEGMDPDPNSFQLQTNQSLPSLFSDKNPMYHVWRTGAIKARRQSE